MSLDPQHPENQNIKREDVVKTENSGGGTPCSSKVGKMVTGEYIILFPPDDEE